jgi:type IV pilus assembly protein PilN
MKIPINLASQPFRRDRAMVVMSLAVSALLAVTLGGLIDLAMIDREQLKGLRGDVSRLNARIRTLTLEQQRQDAVLHRPENASVLERSVFINNLIDHKAISWSRLFTDLEKTVPYNVQVLNLHPTINARNQVMLDMTVGSATPDAVDGLLKALEQSPVFGYVYQHSTLPPSQAEPLYRSRITVPYDQRL